jgi:hypothetical protein
MLCTQETRLLPVQNTQRAWQRGIEANIWPGMVNVRVPLVLRQGSVPPPHAALILWLAYEHALGDPIEWCAVHQAHPLRSGENDVRLYQGRVKFAFRRCTGRCFHAKVICVVLAEWDGARVTRWGCAPGSFRHANSYEVAPNSTSLELEHWKQRCEELEAENASLRARLTKYGLLQHLPHICSADDDDQHGMDVQFID